MESTKKLLEIIAKLEEENLSLKCRVDDLQKELELSGKAHSSDEPLTLQNYYLRKYLEIHKEVFNKRYQKLNMHEIKLREEYEKIMQKEKGLEEISLKNSQINFRIEEIDDEIGHIYYELENVNYDFAKDVKKVTEEEEKITKNTLDVLYRITTLLESANMNVVLNEIKYTMVLLENTFFPINQKIGKTKYDLVKRLENLTTLEQTSQVKIKQLENEKRTLTSTIQEVSLETIDVMLDQLSYELLKVTKSKEELEQLFDVLKEANLKKVQDEIRHLQVLEFSNKEIAKKLDEIMENYYEELMNADTITNAQLNKTVELSELTTKMVELNAYKEEYDKTLDEYNHLNAILEKINNNIIQLEEHSKLTKKAISSKAEYAELVNLYEGTLATINLLEQEIQNTKKKINDLIDERRTRSLDPYAKATIQKLTEQIKANTALVERYQEDLEKSQKLVESILTDEKNLKLMNALKTKKTIENKLPTLYSQQQDLMMVVGQKYDKLNELSQILTDYNKIVERIEELKSEIDS